MDLPCASASLFAMAAGGGLFYVVVVTTSEIFQEFQASNKCLGPKQSGACFMSEEVVSVIKSAGPSSAHLHEK